MNSEIEEPGNKISAHTLQKLRREAGEQLQSLRQAQGLTQGDLANLLGIHEKTFVSQFETGRRRPPADKYVVYAKALDMDPKVFVSWIMKYYEPVVHDILFGSENNGPPVLPAPLSRINVSK